MKSDHTYNGDPRHHGTDITKLQTRIRQLEDEVADLTAALVAATTRERKAEEWRQRGW